MLRRRLQELTAAGLVERTVGAAPERAVTYSLTSAAGQAVSPVIDAVLVAWARELPDDRTDATSDAAACAGTDSSERFMTDTNR